MALTNEEFIKNIKSRYGLAEDFSDSMTVYRSSIATTNQLTRTYLLGDQSNGILGSKYGLQEEIVIIGDHTLVDEDNVFTEYTGE